MMKRTLLPEDLKSARVLSPLELNGMHFANTGAVITPEELRAENAQTRAKGADG